ncbi:hypothetical protein Acr_09g0003390 [Actinidia rufa]|uniref:Uncharacterized protein n=1 Tax=Actinidia rufa TaxID=165716 RepID=A0A7J0F5L9_9ERIC|nr:hypothetical protein Acr_09g0003390 [Actinidia rufa]
MVDGNPKGCQGTEGDLHDRVPSDKPHNQMETSAVDAQIGPRSGELDLDRAIMRFFHFVIQAVLLGSSLIDRNREMREEAMTQQANAGFIRDEMVRAKSVAKDLESRLTELEAKK